MIHLFSRIEGNSRYDLKELPKGREQLPFNNAQIEGWADDLNGPHWYVLENNRALALSPSYRPILEHFRFERVTHNVRR